MERKTLLSLWLLCLCTPAAGVGDPLCVPAPPPGPACFAAAPVSTLAPATQLGTRMTHALCVRLCTLNGLAYASLSPAAGASALCQCGAAPQPGVPAAPPASCSTPCPGNASQPCGGGAGKFFTLLASTCALPLPPSPVGPALPPGRACSQAAAAALGFCNASQPLQARVADLIGRLALAEVGPLLSGLPPQDLSTAIPRLGLPAWAWGIDMAHGITNPPLAPGPQSCAHCVGGRCPTLWPSGPALGASWNASAWAAMGRATAMEVRGLNNAQWSSQCGIDALITWGPVLNLVRDGRWGRIQEVVSEDPLILGTFARAWVRAAQEGPDGRFLLTAITLKHLAVYSLEDYTDQDGHRWSRENASYNVSAFDLADTYLPHFEAGFRPVAEGGGGAAAAMMSMNALQGTPNTANPGLIARLHSWSPQAVVITDGWNLIDSMLQPYDTRAYGGGGHDYCPFHAPPCTQEEGVAAALEASVALALGSEYSRSLQDAVALGTVGMQPVLAALQQALPLRFRLGAMDPAEGQPYLAIGLEAVGSEESSAINALAARQGLVLLKNEGSVLPFAPARGGHAGPAAAAAAAASLPVLLVGFPGDSVAALLGNYWSTVCPDSTTQCFPSLLQALAVYDPSVQYQKGCLNASYCDPSMVAAAVSAVATAGRVVLAVGLDQSQEREQLDRHGLGLPAAQAALARGIAAAAAAHGVPCAAVLVHGGPLALDDTLLLPSGPSGSAGCGAILDAFYPGPLGATAIADALYGAFSPGGKLPYTVPATPQAAAVSFTDHRVAALGRTYRYHAGAGTPGGAPTFQFGQGMSYTTFELAWVGGAPPAQPLVVRAQNFSVLALPPLTLTNTHATWVADEVVSVYFSPQASSVNATGDLPYLPLRQLCAFERVSFLGPGQARVLQLEVGSAALQLTDALGGRGVRRGDYAVWVTRGDLRGSADDLALQLRVE